MALRAALAAAAIAWCSLVRARSADLHPGALAPEPAGAPPVEIEPRADDAATAVAPWHPQRAELGDGSGSGVFVAIHVPAPARTGPPAATAPLATGPASGAWSGAWIDPATREPPRHLELKGFGFLAAASAVAVGVISLLPEGVSKWKRSDDPWANMQENYLRTWTEPPVWDGDGPGVNYVGHPITGMYTYLIPRNAGAGRFRSFLFSTGASFAWEYVIEGWLERPSIQDLLVTSTVGSLLGEAVFQFTRSLLRGGLTGFEKVVLTLVNPVYVVEHGYR